MAPRPCQLLESDVCYACYPGRDLLLCIRMVIFHNCICTLLENTLLLDLERGLNCANERDKQITHRYRSEYFVNIISQPIGFFDADDHSVGALTARLATDPSQLQEILGTNMAFVLISVLNVFGCLVISFYYGWKLTIVTLSSSMPLIVAASFFRIRYEARFEKMNNEVFAQSAKFATESITAFRTVSALTLEDTIIERYETLLREHVKNSFGKSSWVTFIFAVADSIALLCMSFVLW